MFCCSSAILLFSATFTYWSSLCRSSVCSLITRWISLISASSTTICFSNAYLQWFSYTQFFWIYLISVSSYSIYNLIFWRVDSIDLISFFSCDICLMSSFVCLLISSIFCSSIRTCDSKHYFSPSRLTMLSYNTRFSSSFCSICKLIFSIYLFNFSISIFLASTVCSSWIFIFSSSLVFFWSCSN